MDWDYEQKDNWYYISLENGKKYKVGQDYVDKSQKELDISEFEALEMWLDDNDILVNDEIENLTQKAKENGSTKINAKSQEPKKKTQKERVRKENPTKENLIREIANFLQEKELATNVNIENVGKIITFEIGEEHYKIDLIQKRKPKA